MNRYNDIDSSDYNDTNMGVGAYYESTEEKQIARLEKKVAALTNQLALCAAGSWRYDVENAPKDGSEILGLFERPDKSLEKRFVRWHARSWNQYGTGSQKEEEEYQYRPGYMLCICCVKQFPESERHGSYCDECHKGMTAGIKWKEPTP